MKILIVENVDPATFEALLARREAVIAIGEGELRGLGLAALLHSDWAVVSAGATIALDCAEAWSGAVWRIGPGAVRLLLDGGPLSARDAIRHSLVDGIVPAGTDPLQWIEAWLGGRSALALDSAASLIRRRGGDPLERAEFARMFATGETQIGLAAFLAKKPPRWRNDDER